MPEKSRVGALLERIPRPSLTPAWLILVATIVLFNVVFLTVVAIKNEFMLTEPLVLSSFLVKILFDIALISLIVVLLKWLTRAAWPAGAFLAFYFLLSLANIVLYHFGNTMVERHHFALIEPYSVTAYIPVWGFGLILLAVISAFLLFRLLVVRLDIGNPAARISVCLLIIIALTVYNRTGAFSKRDDDRLDRVITGFHNAQIYYACRNQLLSLVKDVTFPALGAKLKSLSPVTEDFVDDYNLASDRFRIAKDLSDHSDTIADWGIPLGPKNPPLTGLKPFTRIIMILAESMSLDALPCFNPEIKAEYATRFFCRPDIAEATFSNLYTSGSPTLQGLTTIFNGHPNYTIHEPTGHRNSFPAMLEKAGFKSVFIRSASKYFANENLVFRSMGFSRIIGREDFYDEESLRRYIYGWGLEDRILYREALKLLESGRDEKMFLAVFGTDTHPPHGQVHFRHLKYPARPGLREAVGKDAWQWIKAVDHMDHDIDGFIRDLKKKGLFDEETLVVVVADHSCPFNNVTSRIPGHPRTNLARIPVVFLSGQPLPQADRGTLASEVDIASTIFHLAGMPASPGWWGDSLFDPDRRELATGLDKGFVSLRDSSGEKLINVDKPADEREKAFLDLFYTVYVENR